MPAAASPQVPDRGRQQGDAEPGGDERQVRLPSEGFAHLDVVTAEDTPYNNVLAPRAAFVARNVQ